MSGYGPPGPVEREIYYCDNCEHHTFFAQCWQCGEPTRRVSRFSSHYALTLAAFVALCLIAYVGFGFALLPRINLSWARYYRLGVALVFVGGMARYLIRWRSASRGSFAGRPKAMPEGARSFFDRELTVMEAALDDAISKGDRARIRDLLWGFDHLGYLADWPKIRGLELRCMAALPISLDTHRRLDDACSVPRLPQGLHAEPFCAFIENMAEVFPDQIGLNALKLYAKNKHQISLPDGNELHGTPLELMRMNRVLFCVLSLPEPILKELKNRAEILDIDMPGLQGRVKKALIADLKPRAGGAAQTARDRQLSLDDRTALNRLFGG